MKMEMMMVMMEFVFSKVTPNFSATVTSNGSPYAILTSCLSVTMVYYGQMVGWIGMPLGTEIGLGPGDIVLDGDPAPAPT